MGTVKNVLVVEDHPLVRLGLIQVLQRSKQYGSFFEASDCDEAKKVLKAEQVDIAVIDITLGSNSANGLELVRFVSSEYPACRMLVVSMHDELLYAQRAIEAGAHGYLMKQRPLEELLVALQCIASGELYLSEVVKNRQLKKGITHESCAAMDIKTLSNRELEILSQIGRGLPPRVIADNLFISVHTVEAHRVNIRKKLGLNSATELMRFAINTFLPQK